MILHHRCWRLFVAVSLVGIVGPAASAQPATDDDKKQGDAVRKGEGAVYTASYDLRDLLQKPESLRLSARRADDFRANARWRSRDALEKAALVVQAVAAHLPAAGKPSPEDRDAIQLLNGTRLLVRGNADQHAVVGSLLESFRRLNDVAVTLNAAVYEVDDGMHTKIKSAKRLTRAEREEQERYFLGEPLPAKRKAEIAAALGASEALFKLLAKQKPVLTRDELRVDDGLEAVLLSQHRALSLARPIPPQAAGPQVVLEGIALLAGVQVSGDRRYVRITLTEKTTEIQEIEKVKALVDNAGKEVDVDIPFLKEAVHAETFEVPDGGSTLIAVHGRPRAANDRRWVLRLTPRIIIEEEERLIRLGTLEAILPAVLADVLGNPRLKNLRELYGTPGDNRFALVSSDAWTWPKEFRAEVAGFKSTPPGRAGQRLLGIKVDGYREAAQAGAAPRIIVTLVNAGGSDNGMALGGAALQYTAKQRDKEWQVELAE